MGHPTIHHAESLADTMNSLLLHYNSMAVLHLERKTRLHTHIHETRLCCKRARAILRLGRSGMESDDYTHFNAFFRDLSAQLAPMRDLSAQIEIAEALMKKKNIKEQRSVLHEVRRILMMKRSELSRDSDFMLVRSEIRDAFAQNHQNILEISFRGSRGEVFGKGIQRIYRRGKAELEVIAADPQADNVDELMHEWRKQVKYLWYQMVVIQPLWPEMLQTYARQLQSVSKILGEYNDLVVMQEMIRDFQFRKSAPDEVKRLHNYCQRRKIVLKKKAVSEGKLIYLFSPKKAADYISELFKL